MVDDVIDFAEDGADRMMQRWQEREEWLSKVVYVADDHVVINVHYEYNIHLNRCRTAEQILAWVVHLEEKTWMNYEIACRFIHVAMKAAGLELKNP